VYAEFLPIADAQVLTEVHLSPRGDTRYPPYDTEQWTEVKREPHLEADPGYEFVWLERLP
jgi:hypothetical protein